MVAIGIGSWPVLLVVLLLAIAYFFLQWYFRLGNVEIQRLESLSRAPPVSHLTATLDGLSSIRAYDRADDFIVQIESMTQWNIVVSEFKYSYLVFVCSIELCLIPRKCASATLTTTTSPSWLRSLAPCGMAFALRPSPPCSSQLFSLVSPCKGTETH